MTPQTQFVLAFLTVVLAVTFALWCKVRLLFLRQSIFDYRDHLFDTAARLGCLEDPGYVAARDGLNVLAYYADRISVPTAVYIGFQARSLPQDTQHPSLQCQNAALGREIDRTYNKLSGRLLRYLLFETVSGWFLLLAVLPLLLTATVFGEMRHTLQDAVEGIVRDNIPADLARVAMEFAPEPAPA